ncbi:S8 family serine peptidase [Eubacteriaceae bacterium ES3]|nr:S8 family serine peptidase [Eubacteriaceae bacterium ES3]
MKKMKSIVSVALVFLIMASWFPVNSFATELTVQSTVNSDISEEQTNLNETASISEENSAESGLQIDSPEESLLTTLEAQPEPEYDESIENQIVVIYKNANESVETLDLQSGEVVAGESVSDWVDVIELKDEETAEQAIELLSQNPNVLSVEKNAVIQASSLPNDPYILDGSAWQFEKIGADKIWEDLNSADEIVVAVIDTGLNTSHPDLAGRITSGYDYVEGSSAVTDLSGHGTMVSGCVAASVNNGIGVSGSAVSANVKIAPYRTGGQYVGDKTLYISHIVAAIMAAADRSDVSVINMSFGTDTSYPTIQSSVAYAVSKGKVLVASAGNGGASANAGSYIYPASFDGVISVAATDSSDGHPSFSQYNDKVDISAPGSSVYTTTRNGLYGTATGTSFSAPIVAGAAALLMSLDETMTATDVETVLKETALDLGTVGKDNYFGYGRIQLDQAVAAVTSEKPLSGISLSQTSMTLLAGNSKGLELAYSPVNTTDNKTVSWTSSDEAVASVDTDGKVTAISAGTATITATVGSFSASCMVTVKQDLLEIGVTYQTHVQNEGWQDWVADGALSGTTGKSLRLEGIHITVDDNGADLGVSYKTHVENYGWMNWAADGALSGTTGQSLRLEGIQIELTGADADLYDIYYQVHAQNIGWLDWAKNGESSGTAGYGYRLEGIKIVVVPVGDPAPGATARPFIEK